MLSSSLLMYRVLRNLLKLLHISVIDEYLRELINEQINDNSLQVIADVLKELNIESKAYQLEKEDLDVVECPVIVHFKGTENKFVVALEFCADHIRYYNPTVDRTIRDDSTSFFAKWSGVVLIPFTDEQSGDPDYTKHTKEKRKKKIVSSMVCAGVFVGIALLFMQMIFTHPQVFVIWSVLLTVKLIALFVVFQILKIESGESNDLITKVCKTTDCGKILRSKASKLFTWLTMGDVGVIYFCAGSLLLIITPFVNEYIFIIYLLFFLNIFTLPYTIFSITYQGFVLKSWCPFCLTIMGILWVEFFLGLTVPYFNVFPLTYSTLLLFGIAFVFISIGWWFLKKLFVRKNSVNFLQMYVNTVKKDVDLFKSVLSNINSVPELITFSDISLGNEYAKNTLIAVISLNCYSCKILFQSIKNFLSLHSDKVKVIFRFQTGILEDGNGKQVVGHLLTLYMNNMKEKTISALEEWYSMENQSVEGWKKKCKIEQSTVSDETKQILKNQQDWLLSSGISAVPVLILNDKTVPTYYNFNDVKYFLKRI